MNVRDVLAAEQEPCLAWKGMREPGACSAACSDGSVGGWLAAGGVAVLLMGMLFPVWWWHPGTLADAMKQPSNLEVGVTSAVWPSEVANRLRTYALPGNVEAEALRHLAVHGWAAGEAESGGRWVEAPVHTLRGVFAPRAGGAARLLLVYSSLDAEESARCHACAPAISVFEFEQRTDLGWQLVRLAVDGTRLGSWGEMPPFHVLDWEPGHTGVFFVLTDGAQGHVSHEVLGFRWELGQWQEVLSQLVGDDPSGPGGDTEGHTQPAWSATWVLGRTPEGALRIQWKGIR